MDNQNPPPNPSVNPLVETPIQNQPIEQTPPSQVYTAPHLDNPPPPPPKKHFSVSKIILPALIVVAIILTISGVYLSQNYKPKPKQNPSQKPAPTSAPSPTPDPTATWKTYENTQLGFSIKYPETYKITERGLMEEEYFGILPPSEINYVIHFTLSQNKNPSLSIYSAINFDKGYGSDAKLGAETLKKTSTTPTEIIQIKIGEKEAFKVSFVEVPDPNIVYWIFFEGNKPSSTYTLVIQADKKEVEAISQILSTFRFAPLSTSKFLDTSPTPTCKPRPACLDATPRCLIPETSDMCPKAVACTQDAKLCPDGSFVGREGPNCEFVACP